MKAPFGCKLLGAQQALGGIRDGVILFHSVVGCNFGSMAFHFASCDMTEVRQTCTVISDNEVVFGGEHALEKALSSAEELYHPAVIFVVTGCVSDIIQDDVKRIAAAFERTHGRRVIAVEAAGYRGNFQIGYEAGMKALGMLMEGPQAEKEMSPMPEKGQETKKKVPEKGSEDAEKCKVSEKGSEDAEKCKVPQVNILGIGADDPRCASDLEALEELFGGKARICTAFSKTDLAGVRRAPGADLNLVFGYGAELAKDMEKRFGIPYVCLDYPYGLTGARQLWKVLESGFGLNFDAEEAAFQARTAEGAKGIYSYLQALYGLPAAVVGSGARAAGLARFLSAELGMEIEVCAKREALQDIEETYDEVRRSEAAFLFGSSFEQELADELEIPLLRFDFPVFDRICLTKRPYIGAEGTLCLLEDLFCEAFAARTLKGAIYQ